MTASERTPADAGRRAGSGAGITVLTVLLAWSFGALALLALSTFLPPWNSFTVLSGVLICAGVLSFLFCRQPSVRDSLEALRAGPEAAKSDGLKRLFGRLLALAGVCLLVIFGARVIWHGRVESLKRELKSKGMPLTLAEFQENLPDGRYAYAALSKAVEKDFSREFYDKMYHDGDSVGRWTPETFRKEAPYAAHYAPYLDKTLAPLLARKYDRYMKVDYAQAALEPGAMPLPPLGNFLPIARAAKICAVSRAYQGDAAKGWSLIRLQLSLAGLLAGEKTVYSRMIALGLQRLAVETALDIMLNGTGAALPADIAGRFKEIMGGRLVSDELKCELAYQFDEYAFLSRLGGRRFVSGGGIFSAPSLDTDSGGSPAMWLQYGGFAVMRMVGMLEINSLTTARHLSALAEDKPWARLAAENRELAVAVNGLPSWPYLLVKLALPEFSRMFEREFELKAWTQVALAYSELGRACREKGRCPKDISELPAKTVSADLLKDVFNGGKLHYMPSKDGKGFELCSPGAMGDRKDAFGKELCVSR